MNPQHLRPWSFLLALLAVPSCGPSGAAETGGRAGAEALLKRIIDKPSEREAISKGLIPNKADCEQVFDGAIAGQVHDHCTKAMAEGVIAPKEGQTQYLLNEATTEQLRAGGAEADRFPGGYKQIAPQMKVGVTWYAFKFVEPGKDTGMAFHALSFVNGHWRLFLKPFNAIK